MVGERTETVMVRLTPEEKRAFKLACVKLGTSMSDVMRKAIRDTVDRAWGQQGGGEEG